MATTRTMTIEELARLPEDEARFELLDGKMLEAPPKGFDHGRLCARLGTFVGAFVEEHSLGVVCGDSGFVLQRDPERMLGPDIAFVRSQQIPPEDEQHTFAELAPDMVVGIVSPSDRWNEVNDKVNAHLDAGVLLIWIVDPRRKMVIVYTPDRVARTFIGNATLDGGDVLPGFENTLERLFG